MDSRLVEFWDKHQATATALKKIIQGKLKFLKKNFETQKYSLYIGRNKGYASIYHLSQNFDLVIIDEASQS